MLCTTGHDQARLSLKENGLHRHDERGKEPRRSRTRMRRAETCVTYPRIGWHRLAPVDSEGDEGGQRRIYFYGGIRRD